MKRRYLLALLACLVCTVFASAQNTPSAEPIHITLGQSVVPLYGPWKFSVGDSPLDPATGAPLWAQSGFDDSEWETVDLTPKSGVFDPLGGFQRLREGLDGTADMPTSGVSGGTASGCGCRRSRERS